MDGWNFFDLLYDLFEKLYIVLLYFLRVITFEEEFGIEDESRIFIKFVILNESRNHYGR